MIYAIDNRLEGLADGGRLDPLDMPLDSIHRPSRILVAEDDQEMRSWLVHALRSADYDVIEAEDGNRVLDYIAMSLIVGSGLDVDLVISDIRMPGPDGLRLLTSLRSHQRDLPVVLITAFGNSATHEEAALRGARAVIDKPFEMDALLAVVRRALAAPDAPPDFPV